MIASRRLRLLAWCSALASSAAGAVGLGEINLHSRIGEPLRADIVVLAADERLATDCFSLAPIPGADIPVLTAARTRLVRGGQGYRLIVIGSAPVTEAAFMINVRAGCGMDLQREYVLLPMPPQTAADSEAPATTPSEAPPRQTRRRRAPPPDGDGGEASERSGSAAGDRATAKPRPPHPRNAQAGTDSGGDRLRLGAALDELPPPAAGDPLAPINALEERMLKMETTLHLIDAQVDRLDKALALNHEARAMRQKLLDLQVQQMPPGALPAAALPAAAPPSPAGHRAGADAWVELILGILLGGGASATIAHLVSRRPSHSPAFDTPPKIARPRPASAG